MAELTILTDKDDIPYEKTAKDYIKVSLCDINRRDLAYSGDIIVNRPCGRPDFLIMYVVRGKMDVLMDSKMHTVYPGDLIYYEPNVPQKTFRLYENKAEHYFVHFIGYAVPDIMKNAGLVKSNIYHIGKNDVISDCFAKIITAMATKKHDVYINSLFLRLISAITENIENSAESIQASRISPAIARMMEAYIEQYGVSYYAELCNMSTARFSVNFKKATGFTPHEFLDNLRIDKAKRLLNDTSLPISDIAVKSGFRDPYYFSRVFKKRFGVSPSTYRKSPIV